MADDDGSGNTPYQCCSTWASVDGVYANFYEVILKWALDGIGKQDLLGGFASLRFLCVVPVGLLNGSVCVSRLVLVGW